MCKFNYCYSKFVIDYIIAYLLLRERKVTVYKIVIYEDEGHKRVRRLQTEA